MVEWSEGRAKNPSDYTDAHSLAIRAANWAMKEDPACAEAHRLRMAARRELFEATRHEIPIAREAMAEADKRWLQLTKEVFSRVMAEKGFPND